MGLHQTTSERNGPACTIIGRAARSDPWGVASYASVVCQASDSQYAEESGSSYWGRWWLHTLLTVTVLSVLSFCYLFAITWSQVSLWYVGFYTPRSLGGYTGFTLFVRPSVCLSVRPSVRPWVGVRMIILILFSGFNFFFFYIYHLGQDLAWDWISASYLIKYAHTGRSCDLLIFGIPEVNFLVRAFQFGMKGVLSRIYDISPGFCWIPIFVFFLNFLRVS